MAGKELEAADKVRVAINPTKEHFFFFLNLTLCWLMVLINLGDIHETCCAYRPIFKKIWCTNNK